MSFLNKLSALVPFGKKEEVLEYFFALNISDEKLTAALWTIDSRQLKILETVSDAYFSLDELPVKCDKLLDSVLGIREFDVQKILFGVPSDWLLDENLKDEYLKILKNLVKELELTPMAYVESANAVIHLLESTDGVPPTAILVGFEDHNLTVTVVRAGKLDGVKVIKRGDNSGADIEKGLLAFSSIETLPSRILLYGKDTDQLKSQLLSYPWMSKLSFLHFPKIDAFSDDTEIKSVCLAGASELKPDILYTEAPIKQVEKKNVLLEDDQVETPDREIVSSQESQDEGNQGEDFGFVVGDVAEVDSEVMMDEDLVSNIKEPETAVSEMDDFEKNLEVQLPTVEGLKSKFSFKKFFVPLLGILQIRRSKKMGVLVIIAGVLTTLLFVLLFLTKAEVKVFVEPKILEKDAQVIADPAQKSVNEEAKIIPGQIIESEVSGSDKESASGKKQVGDPAKGTVIIYNKTSESKNLSKGTVLSAGSVKFSLDSSVNIASQSASDSGITFGKSNGNVTASTLGAEGNLPSGSELSVAGFSVSQLSAKAEGNFSGGTSKDVIVVSSDDHQRLLAKLSSSLKQQAQQKLQEQYKDKKILTEGLAETIVKRTYSKNVGDQASEFTLNLTSRYKGTAFENKDLRSIVSKLVTTQVPEGFILDLSDTETQADVSKLEKDGKLIFLARFKAKLLPKIDTEDIKNKIKGKSLTEATEIIKNMDNVLGSEIKATPSLPDFLQRLPFLARNIKIDVGLK